LKQRPSWVLLAALMLTLVACGSNGEAASTTTPTSTTIATNTSTTTSTTQPTTTTTQGLTTTTTTSGSATTTGSSGIPGEPIDFGPAAGDTLAVIGVAHDDVLNLRAAPGADQDILTGIPPLHANLTAVGETRQLPGSMWIGVEYNNTRGWVNLRFVGYLGDTTDATATIIDNLGGRPVADTMLDLGLIVAESLASDDPKSDLVVTVAPSAGDLGEVTYDVIGLGDDAVRGLRVHVFGEPANGEFSLRTVEITSLCGRGVDDQGGCV